MKLNHKHTLVACCIGYITQAIVNNFLPLMFVTLNTSYGVSLDKLGLLVTINFVIQMAVDFMTARYVGKFGYRSLIIFAHIAASAGLLLLGIAPVISHGNIYPFIVTAIAIYAVGGGLIEVLVSPMVEALPLDNKAGVMSFLHSFYCWGHVGVILISTAFFFWFGIQNWNILTIIWALIPAINALIFLKVPIYTFDEEHSTVNMKEVFKSRMFWLLIVLMIGAGASELGMSQWASYFVERGLGVTKTVGDLLGPCMFAVLMGLSRILYGRISEKVDLSKAIILSSTLCFVCYIMATVSSSAVLSIIGCAMCGFSVGIMWPGVYSLAAKSYARGGTVMFAFLALAGDVGCSAGPTIVGYISNALGATDAAVKTGLLTIAVFPVIMIISIGMLRKAVKKEYSEAVNELTADDKKCDV